MAAQLAVVHLWKEWGLHVLVLLSFMLQVALLVLAELRRRMDYGVLRAFVWSAYMLADSVAIYAIGHLSVTGQAAEHQVMALWSPLLLVHLGGQDNITAYAVEDNRLWLRHLQTLVVQATGAAYVMYVSLVQEPAVVIGSATGGGRDWLRWATALLFAVGIVKYGERVWALISANSIPASKSYRIADPRTFRRLNLIPAPKSDTDTDTEGLWQVAHGMLDVAKNLLKARLPVVLIGLDNKPEMRADMMCKVAEMQLSLMHDVLFSKAEVIHTRYGMCTRAFSWVATAVALFLFHIHQVGARWQHGSSRKDAAVTYVLLAGAVSLETVSGLRSLVSTWTWRFLTYANIWGCRRVADALAALRRCIRIADCHPRAWSGSMGQLNVFHMCSSAAANRTSKIAQWMEVEDWWNTLLYSSSAHVSLRIKDLLLTQVEQSVGIPIRSPNHIRFSRGRAALERWGAEVLLESVDLQFEDSILVWHVATNAYLCWYRSLQEGAAAADDLARAVEALSNYMVYLLAARPYMLPLDSRDSYAKLCSTLIRWLAEAEELHRLPTGELDAARMNYICARGMSSDDPNDYSVAAREGFNLYRCLTDKELQLQDAPGAGAAGSGMILDLIAQVWSEMLCYAGAHCSTRSHAARLSDGSELVTLAALVVRYCVRGNIISSRDPSTTSD
ncbi:unnamed protein product [Urochloa humidicola]